MDFCSKITSSTHHILDISPPYLLRDPASKILNHPGILPGEGKNSAKVKG